MVRSSVVPASHTLPVYTRLPSCSHYPVTHHTTTNSERTTERSASAPQTHVSSSTCPLSLRRTKLFLNIHKMDPTSGVSHRPNELRRFRKLFLLEKAKILAESPMCGFSHDVGNTRRAGCARLTLTTIDDAVTTSHARAYGWSLVPHYDMHTRPRFHAYHTHITR